MSMASLANDRAPRPDLADASLRRLVTSALRKRVPAPEAEDLAQTVLCEALAAPRLPSDPIELRRWVVAVARNKAADWHRRGRRLVPTEDGALDPVDPRVPHHEALEARELLEDVVRTAEMDGGRTLGWLVRQHEGEALDAIAKEEGLPAPVVRQRVSRLRRALRDRYAALLALVLVTGATLAGARALRAPDQAAIVADATTDGARVLAVLQGRWKVTGLALEPASEAALTASERAALHGAGALEIVVDGSAVRLVPALGAGRTLSVVQVGEGTAKLVARRTGGGAGTAVLTWIEGGDVRVRFDDGRIGGTAVLRRGH